MALPPTTVSAVVLTPGRSLPRSSVTSVKDYRPVVPSEPLLDQEVWEETHVEVLQADLDENLGTATPTTLVSGSENLALAITEEEGLRSFYSQGIPAGAELLTDDCLKLYADYDDLSPVPSEVSDSEVFTESLGSKHFDDDEDEFPERFLRTKSTRDSEGLLADKIALDKVQRLEKKEKDRQDWSSSS